MNLNRIFDSLVSSGVAGGLAGGAANTLLVQGLGSENGRETLGKAAARRDLLMLRAMITAAHADGHIDMDERLEIYQRIEGMDLSHAEKGLLMEELSAPLTLEQLVQQVPDRAMAAEVYLAALLMTDSPAPAHRRFQQDLAAQLALPPGFVRSLHDEVEARKGRSVPTPARDGRHDDATQRVSPQA